MTKNLVVGLAILALSTSVASAAHRHHYHHAVNQPAAMSAPPMGMMGPVGGMGPASSSDHAQYLKNLHDSGYDPKNDFNANGNVVNQ